MEGRMEGSSDRRTLMHTSTYLITWILDTHSVCLSSHWVSAQSISKKKETTAGSSSVCLAIQLLLRMPLGT